MQFKYMQITNKKQMGKHRDKNDIKWIVIHDTGNESIGANAMAHYKYLQGASRPGSAHYYVDEKMIIQTIGDTTVAWSCGDNQGKGRALNGCTNSNSISIELCVNKDGNYTQAYKNVLELTKNLMQKFHIDLEHVCRHYDATRKICPNSMKGNDWKLWRQFKHLLTYPIDYHMDLTRDSEFGRREPMNGELEQAIKYYRELGISDGLNVEGNAVLERMFIIMYRRDNPGARKDFSNITDDVKKKLIFENGIHYIETTADKVKITLTSGKNLTDFKHNGINGTFYDTANPNGDESAGGHIAMQDNKEITINSYVNSYDAYKRGTIIYTGERVFYARLNNIKEEFTGNVKWAIGGISLYPSYVPKDEGFIGAYSDVLRKCPHTAVGYYGNKVYLIASKENLSLEEFKNRILNSSISFNGLIALDGGGSTQMYYDKPIINSSRRLNHMVEVLG